MPFTTPSSDAVPGVSALADKRRLPECPIITDSPRCQNEEGPKIKLHIRFSFEITSLGSPSKMVIPVIPFLVEIGATRENIETGTEVTNCLQPA